MNTVAIAAPRWMPAPSWWLLTAAVMAIGILGNWFLAAGVAVVLLMEVARPLDFIVSFLLVMSGAVFVYYEGGQLMRDLSFLALGIAVMLVCYVLSAGARGLAITKNRLSFVLLLFVGLSLLNAGRGYMSGYPIKHVTVELLAILALSTTFLVANTFQPERDLRLSFLIMVVAAAGSAALGYHVFSIIRTHTSGVFFIPVPGIVGLFMFNLALRTRRGTAALAWVVASLPLFLQQFLSFRRGLWVGCLAGFLVSLVAFSGPRAESGPRRRRLVAILGLLVGLGVVGAVVMAVGYGQMDIIREAGARFVSIGTTKIDPKKQLDSSSASNIERLVEYGIVGRLIRESPWVGHGLGYTFLGIKPHPLMIKPQWWVHQNYLLLWLKQGLVGLAVFLWLIATAVRMGVHHARRHPDVWESAWLATSAAATVYMAGFSMSDFPFAEVNVTFMLALFWGGSMSILGVPKIRLRWSVAPNTAAAPKGVE